MSTSTRAHGESQSGTPAGDLLQLVARTFAGRELLLEQWDRDVCVVARPLSLNGARICVIALMNGPDAPWALVCAYADDEVSAALGAPQTPLASCRLLALSNERLLRLVAAFLELPWSPAPVSAPGTPLS